MWGLWINDSKSGVLYQLKRISEKVENLYNLVNSYCMSSFFYDLFSVPYNKKA